MNTEDLVTIFQAVARCRHNTSQSFSPFNFYAILTVSCIVKTRRGVWDTPWVNLLMVLSKLLNIQHSRSGNFKMESKCTKLDKTNHSKSVWLMISVHYTSSIPESRSICSEPIENRSMKRKHLITRKNMTQISLSLLISPKLYLLGCFLILLYLGYDLDHFP